MVESAENMQCMVLEYNLLYFGYATIAFPHSKPGVFFSTQAVTTSNFNVYYKPKKWDSYGINGWRFPVNNSNGVFIYANRARTPLIPTIEFFAHEIEDLYMTRRQNRFNQKTPFILEVPAGQQTAGVNVIKQISGGEMAIMATPGFTDSMKANVLKTTSNISAWNCRTTFKTLGMRSIRHLALKTFR